MRAAGRIHLMDTTGFARRRDWWWMAAAALLVIIVAVALRFGTHVRGSEATFDEPYTRIPIENIVRQGWSTETAIDFEETKGPAFVWTYALLAEILGDDLDDLRLTSVLFFVLGIVPLLAMCRQCGIGGPAQVAVAGLYVLLPYHAPLAQLLMSESSFMFGSLVLMWIFVWGVGGTVDEERRVIGPVLFGIMLAILLHHRIHAVAFAGAACLVALERDGVRSWPWWLACLIAGICRIPLWIRWGGLVSPEFRTMYELGFSPEALTYLAAAYVPMTAVFIIPVLFREEYRNRRWLVWLGAGIGLVLALLAPSSLTETVPALGDERLRFLGITATALRNASSSVIVHRVLLTILATIGMASLGALAGVAWRRAAMDRRAMLMKLLFWCLLGGWGMTVLTDSAVYDRYIVPWGALLPIVWILAIPRWLLILEALLLLAIGLRLTWVWLM
jgi:hypothetical protein